MADDRPAAWLLKTEPESYSFDDLVRDGTTVWDGITNPVALRNVRGMHAGDRVVIYHTGKEKAAVGWARVARAAYPDPAAEANRLVVDIVAEGRLDRSVALAALKTASEFAGSPLVLQGRLSVVPLSASQLAALQRMSSGGSE
ncbi:MAG: EVE domain-containing protein [Gemmatimonadetes bacterium]|nr:EVE domain-containing protein [Gemmatimonadota bacterium]